MPQKFVVVGAGPVGALAAIYAAVRGDDVELYELRADVRESPSVSLSSSKSINLALSERGVHSLRDTGLSDLADAVLAGTFPMHGRMIHMRKNGGYVRQAQAYDARGRNLFSVDRSELNKTLLNYLQAMPNVKLLFNHKLVRVDFEKKVARFEHRRKSIEKQNDEVEISFDIMIGADGAHSAVRYQLMKFVPMTFQQQYIDKLWCQFHIPPSSTGDFRMPPNYLHIWPQGDSMFIALPNLDKSFTATLFLTRDEFEHLNVSGEIVQYFQQKFPGVVPELVSEEELRHQYATYPHLPLISIKCSPYHYGDSGVIVGDSAHAMVPFYGQGMNAGLEDVRVLFEFLDKHPGDKSKALHEYTKQRTPDAHTINDLSFGNYREMASDVKRPLYLLRKWVEEQLYLYVPCIGWATQYSRVSFSNMRYSEVQKAAQKQAKILNGVAGFILASSITSAFWFSRSGGAQQTNLRILRSIRIAAQRIQRVMAG